MKTTGEGRNAASEFRAEQERNWKEGHEKNDGKNQGVEVEDMLLYLDGKPVEDEHAVGILEEWSELEGWEPEFKDGRIKEVSYTEIPSGVVGFGLTGDNDIGSMEAEIGGEVADNPLDALVSVEFGKRQRDRAIKNYNDKHGTDIAIHELPMLPETMVEDFQGSGEFDLEGLINFVMGEDEDLDIDEFIQERIRYDGLASKHGKIMQTIADSGSVQYNHGTANDADLDVVAYRHYNNGDKASLMASTAPYFAPFVASGFFPSEGQGYSRDLSMLREFMYDLSFSMSDQTLRMEDDDEKWSEFLEQIGLEKADIPEHASQGFSVHLTDVEGVEDVVDYNLDMPAIFALPDVEDLYDPETGRSIQEEEDTVMAVVGTPEEGLEGVVPFEEIVEEEGATLYLLERDEEGELDPRMVEWNLSGYDASKFMEKLEPSLNQAQVTISWEDPNFLPTREEKRFPGASPYWKQAVLASAALNEKEDEVLEFFTQQGLGDDRAAWETRKRINYHGMGAELPEGGSLEQVQDNLLGLQKEGVREAYNDNRASKAFAAVYEEGVDYETEFQDFDELVDWLVEKVYLEGNGYDRSLDQEKEDERKRFWEWVAETGYMEEMDQLREQNGSVAGEFEEYLHQGGVEKLLEETRREHAGV